MNTKSNESIENRIDRLHVRGLVDLHFDMPMDLYEKRNKPDVLATHYLPEFETGNIGVVGSAIYIEDRYMPELGLRVGLDQIACLYREVDRTDRFTICKTNDEIVKTRTAGKIAILITMEGV